MRPIKQQHKSGCGIAAIATVAKEPYKVVLRMMHPNYKRKKKFFTNWNGIRGGLDIMGVGYGKLRRTPGKSAADIAKIAKENKTVYIIGAAEKTHQKNWHYLVVSKTGKVYDPYHGKAVNPSGYQVIRSILEIE